MLDHAALSALNHLLAGAAWAQTRLKPHAGRSCRLCLPPLQLDFAVDSDGFLAASGTDNFDVTIELPPAPQVAINGLEVATKTARINGAADFADALGFVLRNLRWDYEEDLSKLVGDIAAHRLTGQLQSLFAWQKQATRNFAENLAEYFTEEQPLLVKPEAIGQFTADVQRLDADIMALEQRLGRLGGNAK